ncbi:MAG: ANTAR domain-containing protein [Actinomycetes bacterium]
MSLPESGPLLDALAGFAGTLTRGYGIGDVLHDLASRIPDVLGVVGAGVTLKHDGRVHFVTAPVEAIALTESLQDELQSGPCIDAVASGRPVTVDDLADADPARRWPEYAAQARAAGLRAVAGIPMHADRDTIGAINLYDNRERRWSEDDVRVAGILADVATVYLMYASALQEERRTSEQLQQALDTRIVIEQAKGILATARGVSLDGAFEIMRKQARDNNARIHDVADTIVNHGPVSDS